jgi:ribosomal protein L37AE/L43A
MTPIPRSARVPLTAKQPEACPHCGSRSLRRRGTRKKKLEIVQLWRCASCKRTFTPGPLALHNKTYPLRMILSAPTDYDTGFTLQETAARLKKKTHRNVSPSTIASWLEQYKRHCSYRRLRARGLSRFPANQTIRAIKLYHRQIYSFAYHRPKLEFLRAGSLDDKRRGDTRFAPLADVPLVRLQILFARAIRHAWPAFEPQKLLSTLPLTMDPAIYRTLANRANMRIFRPSHPPDNLLRGEVFFEKVLDVVGHPKVVLDDERFRFRGPASFLCSRMCLHFKIVERTVCGVAFDLTPHRRAAFPQHSGDLAMRALLFQHTPNDFALGTGNMRVVGFQKSYWNSCCPGHLRG